MSALVFRDSAVLSSALSTDSVDGMEAGAVMVSVPPVQLFLFFLSWPFPAEPGIALAAEPEPHDRAVRLSPSGAGR